MTSNIGQLVTCKVLFFGSPRAAKNVACDLGRLSGDVKLYADDLDILFDPDLKFNKEINSLVKSSKSFKQGQAQVFFQ